ncbi:MAG: SDR family oxidoreductase, partial [Phaeodactylibacter sp.]|nr:SDR family oxidoreductase [Phaeodactylibacter sp.]
GATGFLGAYLLRELLQQTRARIYCLVRAADEQQAFERIRANLEQYGMFREENAGRIQALAGDISQPLLGLAPDQYDALADTIGAIYHNAAQVNFIFPY